MSDLVTSNIHSLEKAAEMIATSELLPPSLRGKPGSVLLIFMMADELRIPRIQAIQGINVIQGRPTVSPQLMIALIKGRVPHSFIQIEQGPGWAKCTMSRDEKDMTQAYTSIWDMKRAEKLLLSSKDNYKKQPETMLKWRAVGDCARTVFPDVLAGFYFPDELNTGEFVTDHRGEPVEVQAEVSPGLPEQITIEYKRLLEEGMTKGKIVEKFGTSKGKTEDELRSMLVKMKHESGHTHHELLHAIDNIDISQSIK